MKRVLYLIVIVLPFCVSCSDKNDNERFIPLKKIKTDYEYFWNFFDNTYPFKNVCKRHDVVFESVKLHYDEKLASIKTRKDYYEFFYDLIGDITKAKHFGHFFPISYNEYVMAQEYFKNHFDTYYKDSKNMYENIVSFYNSNSELNSAGNNTQNNSDNYDEQSPQVKKFNFKILEENNIAYLKIRSFKENYNWDDLEMHWQELHQKKCKHLIFDIRGNTGGYDYLWREYLVAPFIKESAMITLYFLYKDSEIQKPFINKLYRYNQDSDMSFIPKENLNLTKLVKGDIEAFTVCVKVKYKIASDFCGNDFIEKIWVLTDIHNYSASDLFAFFCKQTGFATLVGNNTKGNGLNIIPAFFSLPNSGMLIRYDPFYGLNPDGSSNAEVGTAPDIYNLPGKDALETCLEEIKKLESGK